MASGYGVSSIGRGRSWRNNKHAVDLQCQNTDIKDPFGLTMEPWRRYQDSTGGSNTPVNTHFKYENDDEVEGEENVACQQAQATKNVMDILSGTCCYLTDPDNMSVSTCDDAADEIFPSFSDPYNFSISMTAKGHRQAGSLASTSTYSVKNKKPSAHSLTDSPVNKLEEVSKHNKLPPPSYSLVSRKVTPKGFVAVCEFLDYIETGHGNSQNEAREEAAIKMLENLHLDDDSLSEYDYGIAHSFQYNVVKEEDQKGLQDGTPNKYKAPYLQGSNLNLGGFEHCQRDQLQQESDRGSRYPLPEFSLKPTGNKQYVWLVQSIASKMNFEVKYEILPHRTSNALAQCVVHLCKDPPIVCYGSAKSENKAKSSAARCAFEYLKIVYQK
ncbi:RISC-loading complex subunit tarbp2-like [Schistocerca americana]|uniref:RISC-loading complex subunit tarbp2-like n=1 Tax=Schistocerca americana TaxID=7009 RepID=UPI001F4FC480|nr:RISC-loading complex subunit tarbp2-like [Schistocerca americana]XP_046980005.1 RISC-loading complex subunit tarbp2-like [Schistocerca americana]XP_046980006.1 RISC-loading complex subunit tarbp2-like [Schistocerca americana]